MRVLILGITGMLGNAVFKTFLSNRQYEVWGTLRNEQMLQYFPKAFHNKTYSNIDVLNHDSLREIFERVQPQIVINCIGLIKQLAQVNDPLSVIPINTLFPHQLAKICGSTGSRLIHISTDCVFSGRALEPYTELCKSDAEDLYGKSKYIGEVSHLSHVVTLRTSIIGHELNSNYGLVDWFLSRIGTVKGYVNAIFSGLPTYELAKVIHDFVIPNNDLTGLYHVSSEPISKFTLLNMIADIYDKNVVIEPEYTIKINRALNSARFKNQTSYVAPEWPILIESMFRNCKQKGYADVR